MGLAIGSHKALNLSPRSLDVLTEALPNTPPLLRFIAVGDTGHGDRGQYAVANAMETYAQSSPFLLVLLAGDNIYQKIGSKAPSF
jgi:hypothetical protein